MRLSTLTIVFLVLACCASASEIPDPDQCVVEPWDDLGGAVFVPFASGSAPPELAQVTISIRHDSGEPWPNAYVELVFLDESNHHFCKPTALTGNTDAQGILQLVLPVGGCTRDSEGIQVIADGTLIRSYLNAKSPDVDGDGQVGLGDLIALGSVYNAGTAGCTDFDNDANTGLPDFIMMASVFGGSCEE